MLQLEGNVAVADPFELFLWSQYFYATFRSLRLPLMVLLLHNSVWYDLCTNRMCAC